MTTGKKITVKLVLVAPSKTAATFHLDLVKRMHKYLSKFAIKVHAVDLEINE